MTSPWKYSRSPTPAISTYRGCRGSTPARKSGRARAITKPRNGSLQHSSYFLLNSAQLARRYFEGLDQLGLGRLALDPLPPLLLDADGQNQDRSGDRNSNPSLPGHP